jgi:hypothetical protein
MHAVGVGGFHGKRGCLDVCAAHGPLAVQLAVPIAMIVCSQLTLLLLLAVAAALRCELVPLRGS